VDTISLDKILDAVSKIRCVLDDKLVEDLSKYGYRPLEQRGPSSDDLSIGEWIRSFGIKQSDYSQFYLVILPEKIVDICKVKHVERIGLRLFKYDGKGKRGEYNAECPLCGCDAFDLVFSMYCSNKECKNYRSELDGN
jgi:hypothetical protein